MPPAATDPSSASVIACSTPSPSECPASPSGCSSVIPPILSGTPALNACESQPNPMRVSMVFMRELLSLVLPTAGRRPAQSDSAGALVKVEGSQFQIARLGNLQINLRAGYDRYWNPPPFHH